ncbi:tRNA pseudouridine(55) synthase TruB [Halalkalibacillus sediminis]|uniref:tRNA pseudouridine synthase B n=1 Tax=Halalkalibacillus sediminis TaxID=2018042 RepID=A0A2I0QWE5_9BACI|nr:tRNA pseudouridine(55) synthase TruB [Halalkalibacillus sediminis]PKR78666.1 tRNA pseudouridine(55) synthase TruB [Halalkalibacillus sediminis]
MNGIIPLWKPKGMTSHDCVDRIRKIMKTKKVGHTGTLDPEVEGVLPICIGKATKIVSLMTQHQKEYRTEISLGRSTTTEDFTGETVETKEVDRELSIEECEKALNHFIGEIDQIPPMYSAVKVNGMKLYEYAREGLTVERPSRVVKIHNITLLSGELVRVGDMDVRFTFNVHCSGGTYIRTLCVDIGKALGYPAHMSELTRLQSGAFVSDDSVTFSQIQQAVDDEDFDRIFLPMKYALPELREYVITDTELIRFHQGQVLPIPEELTEEKMFKVIDPNGALIAIYQPHPKKTGLMKPVKVLV